MSLKLFSSFIIAVLFCAQANAQTKIDSLKSLLPSSDGAQRCDILFALGYEYIDLDNNEAYVCGLEGFQISKSLNDKMRIVKSGRILAGALKRTNRIDSAITIYEEITRISKENNFREDLRDILIGVSSLYSSKAQYDKALTRQYESLTLCRQLHDTASMTLIFNNIGLIYYKLNDYDKALTHYRNALRLKLKIDDQYHLDRLHINISLCYTKKGQFTAARNHALKGLTICGNNCPEQKLIEGYYALALTALTEGNLASAKEHAFRGYSLAKKSSHSNLFLTTQICYAKSTSKKEMKGAHG
jgi:tetratricopeptide (TPR) repeat protein